MTEPDILSGKGAMMKLFECTAVSMGHNFFLPTYISPGVRSFLPSSLVELSLDCIFASLGRELKAGRGDNPLDFSSSLPVMSPRRGYVPVPVELTARLNSTDEGVFAVISLRGEEEEG